jgi:hypothetical protein
MSEMNVQKIFEGLSPSQARELAEHIQDSLPSLWDEVLKKATELVDEEDRQALESQEAAAIALKQESWVSELQELQKHPSANFVRMKELTKLLGWDAGKSHIPGRD